MKKIISFIFILLVLIAVIAAYLTFGTATAFDEKFKSFVVEDGKTDKASVLQTLEQQHIIDNTLVFGLLADRLDVWNRLKPGKFQLKNGDNLFTLAKILRNNRQAEVKLIINKLRTKEDFAKARPFAEALPELAVSIRKGRGPNKAPTKKLVSLRLSGQVIDAYRAKGPGWQSKIDADLRKINKIR